MTTTHSELGYSYMLKTVVKSYGDVVPTLHQLASIALTLPISTADCERGFSVVGRVKTKLRNRLSQKILRCLLYLSAEGPATQEFNYSKAANV
ncbi:zinc finger protein 862-like [Saccoglossus kowalevskii]